MLRLDQLPVWFCVCGKYLRCRVCASTVSLVGHQVGTHLNFACWKLFEGLQALLLLVRFHSSLEAVVKNCCVWRYILLMIVKLLHTVDVVLEPSVRKTGHIDPNRKLHLLQLS